MSEKKLLNRRQLNHDSREMSNEFIYGPWHVEYKLLDGGRLTRVAYKDYDLLTTAPSFFHSPKNEQGQYEHRPVYGYDDCFPSVGACYYPNSNIYVPDHGEVCWLSWELLEEPDSLTFLVKSKLFPIIFKRKMIFTESSINWSFEVLNEGTMILPFQHSMHPLIRVDEIKWIELPEFESAFDWNKKYVVKSMTPGKVAEFLLGRPEGSVEMLFLRNIKTGKLNWKCNNGVSIKLSFPVEHFPTVGIWWNKNGYPDEDGIRRNECAFEPTAGHTSVLSQAYADGNCLSVGPGEKFTWQISWEMES